MIVVDTGFFIGLYRQQDEWHQRALEITEELSRHSVKLLVTTHVIEETVSFIFKHDGSEKAFQTALTFLTARNILIEPITRKEIHEAAEIMRKYKQLSLCDSLSAEVMRKYGIKQILSFDKGFDRLEKIQRIH